jgi:hypothetical protein
MVLCKTSTNMVWCAICSISLFFPTISQKHTRPQPTAAPHLHLSSSSLEDRRRLPSQPSRALVASARSRLGPPPCLERAALPHLVWAWTHARRPWPTPARRGGPATSDTVPLPRRHPSQNHQKQPVTHGGFGRRQEGQVAPEIDGQRLQVGASRRRPRQTPGARIPWQPCPPMARVRPAARMLILLAPGRQRAFSPSSTCFRLSCLRLASSVPSCRSD